MRFNSLGLVPLNNGKFSVHLSSTQKEQSIGYQFEPDHRGEQTLSYSHDKQGPKLKLPTMHKYKLNFTT